MKRWLKRIAIALATLFGLLVAFAATVAWLASQGYLQSWGLRQGQKGLLKEFPELAAPAGAWQPAVAPSAPESPAQIYSLSNIWPARLSFTAEQWKGIAPSSIPPVKNMFEHGRIKLLNPEASRNGLAGAVGIEFNWTPGTLVFAETAFSNVAVRYRGNGTYLNSLFGPKQSFKVDLNKFEKGQDLAGLDEFNFLNSIADDTYLRDAMSEQLFRKLGVPAPRTGYAYLTLHVPGKFENQPLGLYVLAENIDSDFAKDRFGSKKTPIFKPVTYELFDYLGENWEAYDRTYDLKTEATPEQLKRVTEFARLVSKGDDEEFNRRLPEFLDLEEFAAFVAGHVLLSSCDGFLANGQNYFMYLDPRTDKFGFISWDHDHSFGEFGYVQTAERRERMSIWEPYLYEFRFLARVMKNEAFREVYRTRLETALEQHFTEQRLSAEVDRLASMLRPAVAAESSFRLRRFEKAVSDTWDSSSRDGTPEGPRSPVRPIKQFIKNRIESVRAQLEGKSEGLVLRRSSY